MLPALRTGVGLWLGYWGIARIRRLLRRPLAHPKLVLASSLGEKPAHPTNAFTHPFSCISHPLIQLATLFMQITCICLHPPLPPDRLPCLQEPPSHGCRSPAPCGCHSPAPHGCRSPAPRGCLSPAPLALPSPAGLLCCTGAPQAGLSLPASRYPKVGHSLICMCNAWAV